MTQIGLILSIAALGLWPPTDALAFVSAVSLLVAHLQRYPRTSPSTPTGAKCCPRRRNWHSATASMCRCTGCPGWVPGSLGAGARGFARLVLDLSHQGGLHCWSAWGLTLSVKEAVAEPRIPAQLGRRGGGAFPGVLRPPVSGAGLGGAGLHVLLQAGGQHGHPALSTPLLHRPRLQPHANRRHRQERGPMAVRQSAAFSAA